MFLGKANKAPKEATRAELNGARLLSNSLTGRLDYLEHNLPVLRSCQKCGHETLQVRKQVVVNPMSPKTKWEYGIHIMPWLTQEAFYCPNCGTTWLPKTETKDEEWDA